LGCVRNDINQSIEHANTWLLEVDTAGNVVRQWFDPNDSTYVAEGLLQTQDGGFIYGAQKKFSESGGLVAYTNTIVKMNDVFMKEWTYTGGRRSIYTGISDIEQLLDGSYIACGQYPIYGTDTALWGCVIKLDEAGNVLWEKNYRGINATQTQSFLSDIDVLPDGSLIAVGQCKQSGQSPPQVGWFLKLDANGCEVENCLVGIDGEQQTTNFSQIQIQPNPANGSVQVQIENEMIGAQVKVYDIQGQLMLLTKADAEQNTIDISALSSGMYVVTIDKGNKQARSKLVVE
jgi:hypothetical protein